MAARGEILRLQRRGESYASIGRALGINRSLVRQVALGRKPGRNLEGPLRSLGAAGQPLPLRGGPLAAITRRVTAAGTPARVRGRAREAATRAGRVRRFVSTRRPGSLTLRRELGRILGLPGQPTMRVRAQFREVQRYRNGAVEPHAWVELGELDRAAVERAEAAGTLGALIRERAQEQVQDGRLEYARGVERVELETSTGAEDITPE